MRSLRALACLCLLPACSLAARTVSAPDATVDRPAPADIEHPDVTLDVTLDTAPPDRGAFDVAPDDAPPDVPSIDLASVDVWEASAPCLPGTTTACYSGRPATRGVGACLGGTRICDGDGRWAAACVGEVTPAADDFPCNEVDDDCTGFTDKLCEDCSPGGERPCYTGRRTVMPLVGRCRAGGQRCDLTRQFDTACVGEVLAADGETCGDGVDDDCNGAADENCGACAATQQRPCYSGPAGTEGVGVCHGGAQRCGLALTWAATCQGELTPAAEVCSNGLDDDCDGVVDDHCDRCDVGIDRSCYSDDPVTRDVGRCRGGTRQCARRDPWLEGCEGEATPVPEVCANGVDDDCDGASDEGCAAAVPGALALGRHRSCAVMSDGSLRCWGSNLHGVAGGVRSHNEVRPREVPGGAASAAVGTDFLCARQGDGAVRCAGRNQLGQLGDGGTVDRALHGPIPGLAGVDAVVAGRGFACARIAADGSVRCWGSNRFGQLGRSADDSCRMSASVVVPCGTSPGPVAGLTGAMELAAGAHHVCARMADGTVRCWGDNTSGQLGDGTTLSRATPVAVADLSGVVQLTAGYAHTCALSADGTARCWGENSQGQLGDGTTVTRTTPRTVVTLREAAQLAAGDRFTCARRVDGTVRCWGGNAWGQLGDGSTARRVVPTAVAGLIQVAEVAAGGEHTCVRLTAGSVLCWGWNLHGQLGDGSTVDRLAPRLVEF